MVSFQGLVFHDRAPVYLQLSEHLKRQILLGTAAHGDPLPSRRELAAQTGINPNTAQKAYRLMEEEGLVETHGNSASTVRLTPALRAAIEEELTQGLVEQFVREAKGNHLSYKRVIALISELWGDD
ncbi:MAG: GntR family transcriptional regulator [Gemmiger sp.]|nr:GntR family transcriptional regulator [Gemmiger sp.]